MNTSLGRHLGPTLLQFLTSARNHLKSSLEDARPLHIVTGNESADLDSFASSILYAYFSSPSPSPSSSSSSFPRPQSQSSSHSVPVPIPLLLIPRSDLTLRPEFLHLLSEISLPSSSLFFLDDFPDGVLSDRSTTFSLVDHNVLHPIFGGGGGGDGRVTSIIDHHADEGYYKREARPRIVDVSGSCSSLVVEHFLGPGTSGQEGTEEKEQRIQPEISKLGLAAILIDTANMGQRVTAHDESALSILEASLIKKEKDGGKDGDGKGKTAWDRTTFYTGLQNAKSSIGNLSLRDILRKDYKQWSSEPAPSENVGRSSPLQLGISATVKPLSYLLSREPKEGDPPGGGKTSFLSAISSWVTERNLDVFALMTASTSSDGDFSRELFLWVLCNGDSTSPHAHHSQHSPSPRRTKKKINAILSKFLSEAEKEDLYLEEFEEGELGDGVDFGGERSGNEKWDVLRAWRQRNLKASRKQVGPILRRCF